MTGRVLELTDVIQPDMLATRITEMYQQWDMLRRPKMTDWEEVRRYVYATDTTQTSNSKNPWKNKTTIPKLCQTRDNIYANYTATLFPQRKWLEWEANTRDSNSVAKRDAIVNYTQWMISQPSFKHEMDKIVLDYIDFGNCVVTVDWADERTQQPNMTQAGYIGPVVKRISPLDTVFNPTAESFLSSPKIFKSIMTMGEVKEMISRLSNDDNREMYEALWTYLREIRSRASTMSDSEWQQRDNLYAMDGFTSFREYLKTDLVEILTFYGDLYDSVNDMFLKNHVITVVDRHKIIDKKPNPSFFGYPPIFHAPWRKKQDNLWGMGPLDNLIGMQYRLDHVENMKADIYDLTTYPVQMITGFVEDYVWEPGAKIYCGEEGKVELLVPDVQALQANFELDRIERQIEEMAGAPREAMGFRTPGEKTKYEVQRLENAAARVFQNKIKQFEEQIVEPVINAMLEMARRNLTGPVTIKVFDDEFKFSTFQTLTVEDITGIGRIKPVAARHFAEQADLIQNLTNLTQSNLWPKVMQHFSSIKLAKIVENAFNLEQYEVVTPNIGITEQFEAQKKAQALQEAYMEHTQTASGIGSDYDLNSVPPETTQQPMQPQ